MIGGRMKGYFGGVGGGVGQWKKSSCDTNSVALLVLDNDII